MQCRLVQGTRLDSQAFTPLLILTEETNNYERRETPNIMNYAALASWFSEHGDGARFRPSTLRVERLSETLNQARSDSKTRGRVSRAR
jgi:hypothetical protein